MSRCVTTLDACIPRSNIQRQSTTKSTLTKCPEMVDHYKFDGANGISLVLRLSPSAAYPVRLISLLIAFSGGLIFALSSTPVTDITEVDREA